MSRIPTKPNTPVHHPFTLRCHLVPLPSSAPLPLATTRCPLSLPLLLPVSSTLLLSGLAQDAQGGNFSAVPGKYELIETDTSDATAAAAMVANGGGASSSPAGPVKVLPSKLNPATKELVELIFR